MSIIEKLIKGFYWVIIVALFIILIFSTVELIVLIWRTLTNSLVVFDFSTDRVDTSGLFVNHVQRFIAGILMLTIIIELIQSFFVFVKSEAHSKYLVIIYEIAMIAIVRHLFTLDLEHIHGNELIGISILVLVLGALNYFNKPSIIKKLTNLKKQNQNDDSGH
ncbi:phosphate-starvation-inducible PsiE family protein [Winogradskyella alexanderae]|uniref:Phosphate-starvation-inducible PsiE family protein n=1 Tax=Winogradskyella alexanderae TaxID=2877123 RepID=A0ABS7XU63_9FLAO|nr:phosphate-starvation-inducible PsiE family protein [Winogradskyella alexanderae]MCA0133320.1 phosphate-starvation-inducible PsiE family protein [Winogradskyella alexanderae]